MNRPLRIVTFMSMLVLLGSCGPASHGRIEERVEYDDFAGELDYTISNVKEAYLVNTSSSRRISFTVRHTVGREYDPQAMGKTYVYTVAPGEDISLGKTKEENSFGNYDSSIQYEIVGAVYE